MNDIQNPDPGQVERLEEKRLQIEQQKLELKKDALKTAERLAILAMVGLFIQANLDELLQEMGIALGVWLASLGYSWKNSK